MGQGPWEKYQDSPWTKYDATTAATTLLDSRKAASKGEFEANQPQSTMLTRARELALGGAEGLGVNPESPIIGTAGNMAGGFLGFIKGLATNPVPALTGAAKGIGDSLISGPVEAWKSAAAGDYDAMAHGVGKTVAADIPAVYAAKQGVDALRNASRDPAAIQAAAVKKIEQKLKPSSTEAKLTTERIAPELAKNPVLVNAKPKEFDKALFGQFKEAEKDLVAVEKTVPRSATVPQQDITNQLEQIAQKYEDMGATEAAAAVRKEWDKWASKPTDIPWEEFLTGKRRLGGQMKVMGQFRESGTAAEKATGAAMREANRVLVNASNGISQALAAANKNYSVLHSAVESAGLSFNSGRRVAGIGKEIPTTLQKLKPYAVKAGLGAAGATAYGVYEKLK
jgi:hypothetical protein